MTERGPDPYERAVERGPSDDADEEPPLPSGRGTRRLMLFVLGAGLIVAVVKGGFTGSPTVPGSCTQPVLALTPTTVRAEGSVQWTLTGPKDARVVLATGVTSPPAQTELGWLAGPIVLKDCRAKGVFAAPSEGGKHTVRVFRVDGGGGVVTSQPLEVGR